MKRHGRCKEVKVQSKAKARDGESEEEREKEHVCDSARQQSSRTRGARSPLLCVGGCCFAGRKLVAAALPSDARSHPECPNHFF